MPDSLPQPTHSRPLERIVRHVNYRKPVTAKECKPFRRSDACIASLTNEGVRWRPALYARQPPVAKRRTLVNEGMILTNRLRAHPGNRTTDRAGQPSLDKKRREEEATACTQLPALEPRKRTWRSLTPELSGGCRDGMIVAQPTRSRPLERIVRQQRTKVRLGHLTLVRRRCQQLDSGPCQDD